MSLNVKVLSFSKVLNPLSRSLFILWFLALVLNIQGKGQKLNSSLIKALNITFLLKSVIDGATLIWALNFWLTIFTINFAWLWKFKSLFITIPWSFCLASAKQKAEALSGALLLVEMILGFRSKALVILIKCILKIIFFILS